MTRTPPSTPERFDFGIGLGLALLLCWVTLERFLGIRFTNSDDMLYSVVPFGSLDQYWTFAANDAAWTGRFGVFYTSAYWLITNRFWDSAILDGALFGPLAAVLVAILFIARRFGRAPLGLLFIALYLAFILATFQFNLLVSYPLKFTSGILIFFVALLAIDTHLRTARTTFVWLGCALLFAAFTHHETLFAVFSANAVIFIALRQEERSARRLLANPALRAVLVTIGLYIVAYVTWYATHPPRYEGTSLQLDAPGFLGGYFKSMAYYLEASLPLYHFFHGYALPFIDGGTGQYAAVAVATDLAAVLGAIDVRSLVRASIVALAVLYGLRSAPALPPAVLAGMALGGLVTVAAPAAIISLSATYQVYVLGGYAPLHPAFFGYFGVILCLCAGLLWLLPRLPRRSRKIACWAVAAAAMVGSQIADSFNAPIVKAMRINTERWTAASLLLRHWAATGKEERPGMVIAPQLWNVAGYPGPIDDDYWQRLAKIHAGLDIAFTPREEPGVGLRTEHVYYQCPSPAHCLILIHRGWDDAILVLTTSPEPRYLRATTREGPRTIVVLPLLGQPPTLLRYGLYSATLTESGIDFATLRPQL